MTLPPPDRPRPNIPPAADEEASGLPPEAARRLIEIGADPHAPHIRGAVRIGMAFGGPIPPPGLLESYRAVHPDLPERIIAWTETQTAHRQSLERAAHEGAERRMNRGQLFTFVLAGLGLILSALVGVFGSAVVASILALVAVGGPTAAFVLARSVEWSKQGPGQTRRADK